MTKDDLIIALKSAKKRNKAAYDLISIVCGVPKKKIKDIVNGKIEPTAIEIMMISACA